MLLAPRSLRRLFAALLLPLASSASAADKLQTIAFGSCLGQNEPQPIWEAVLASKPDLWIWGGDNIYGDTEDMTQMAADWQALMANPGYTALRNTGVPILGTWDDHDYGENDAGANYPMREASQQLFLDFLGVAQDSPRRSREGVYHAEVFGEPGQRVQVIVLDTRYHRSDLKVYPKLADGQERVYYPVQDRDATVLGEDQWTWLEQQLQVPAELRLIVTSIQVISEEHRFEKWSNFPRERRRLLGLIEESGADGVILLSGDRHRAELSKLDDAGRYPLYELTSSGLNKSRIWPGQNERPPEPNRHRVNRPYWGHHYGLLQIDWDQPDPVITLEIRDTDNAAPVYSQILLSEISPGFAATLVDRTVTAGREADATAPASIVMDGQPTEWPAGTLLTEDPEFFYLRFATASERSLNRGGEPIEVVLDFADTDTDLRIVFDPVREEGDRRWGPQITLGSASGDPLLAGDIGLQTSPSHASQWFELRFSKAQLRRQLKRKDLAGPVKMSVSALGADGVVTLAADTLENRIDEAALPVPKATPIPGKPAGGLRVLSYNLLWGSHLENPEAFARMFKALDADIYLFQEWSRERITALEATHWFSTHVDPDRDWHAAVGGGAGSWHGTLMVSPHGITGALPRHAPLDAGGWSFPMRLAGGVVDTPIGKVMAASTHLKASGHLDSREDVRRFAEADALNRLLLGASAASEAKYTLLGGDFNLNGSVDVLNRAVRMLDMDGSALTVAQPTMLGTSGLLTTFGRPYPVSRLDYVAYPDRRLSLVNGFVLNTGELDTQVLKAHGLKLTDTQSSDHYPVVLDLVPKP